jgi:hypothetical protein
MVKENELRIGNWYKVDATVLTEESFAQFDDWQDAGHFLYDCSPIPLTPEILEDCGFEEVYKSPFTHRFDFKKNKNFGAGWNLVNGHFHIRYKGEYFTNIKHLHKLQNLFFALDEELIFHPK